MMNRLMLNLRAASQDMHIAQPTVEMIPMAFAPGRASILDPSRERVYLGEK